MLSDLAALTPPLIVCAAFIIGLIMFLRRQMGPAGKAPEDDDDDTSIPAESGAAPGGERNGDPDGVPQVSSVTGRDSPAGGT